MIAALQLDEPGAGNALGEVAPGRSGSDGIAAAGQGTEHSCGVDVANGEVGILVVIRVYSMRTAQLVDPDVGAAATRDAPMTTAVRRMATPTNPTFMTCRMDVQLQSLPWSR
jgi:hypothetical protein